jgi:hypothetical protein
MNCDQFGNPEARRAMTEQIEWLGVRVPKGMLMIVR